MLILSITYSRYIELRNSIKKSPTWKEILREPIIPQWRIFSSRFNKIVLRHSLFIEKVNASSRSHRRFFSKPPYSVLKECSREKERDREGGREGEGRKRQGACAHSLIRIRFSCKCWDAREIGYSWILMRWYINIRRIIHGFYQRAHDTVPSSYKLLFQLIKINDKKD